MKSTLYYLLLFFFPSTLAAQINIDNLYQEYRLARRYDPTYWKIVKGSPYENQEFTNAFVFLKNNPIPEKGRLRYNLLFDEMELLESGNDEFLIVDKKETIDSIILDNQKFRFMVYEENEETKKGFLVQLNSGKCILYVKKPREYRPEKFPEGGYQDYVPPSILIKPEKYYIQFENQLTLLLPQSTKNIIEIFRRNGFDVSSYVKKNRTKYNVESLLAIVDYCNSLK